MQRLMLSVLLVALCIPAFAKTSVETVTVSAYGDDEVSAISNALAQAVQQVNGVDVRVVNALTATEPQILIDWLGNKIVLEGGRINKGMTVTQAAGPVRRYQVTDSHKEGERWQVSIEADIVHYQAWNSEKINLPTLAISPFETDKPYFETLEGRVTAKEVAGQLQQLLNHRFSQSGRFRMLDRRFVDEAVAEHRFTRQFSDTNEHALRSRQKLGADVLLVGMIRDFDLGKSREKLYDSYNDLYYGDFLFDIQAVEVATGEILWSERIKQRYTHQQLRTALRQLMDGKIADDDDKERAEKDLQEQVYREQALAISRAVISHFYPVRVLQSAGDDVYLSQGSGILAVGDRYRIAGKQAGMVDPDTGSTLQVGSDSILVQVTDVTADYARARVVKGNAEAVKKGAEARYVPVSDRQAMPSGNGERTMTPGSSEKPLKWH